MEASTSSNYLINVHSMSSQHMTLLCAIKIQDVIAVVGIRGIQKCLASITHKENLISSSFRSNHNVCMIEKCMVLHKLI